MKPSGSDPCSRKHACKTNLKEILRPCGGTRHLSTSVVPISVSTNRSIPSTQPRPIQTVERPVEQKRLLIRKQLVILLHAIVCRRRDLTNTTNGQVSSQLCNVPFCGLMKTVLGHLNSCKTGRTCQTTHCASSRQILIHWKYCVKTECPVCVSLRQVIPSSLLSIFPNPLCRAEVMNRVARQQQNEDSPAPDQAVPELMESEE